MKVSSIDNLDYLVSVNRMDASDQDQQSLLTDKKKSSRRASLTLERTELIKRRIAENFYNQDEILKEIAERMVNSEEFTDFVNRNNSSRNL